MISRRGRIIGHTLLVMAGITAHFHAAHAGKLAGQTLEDLAAAYPDVVVVRILTKHETVHKGGFAPPGAMSARYQMEVMKVLKGRNLTPRDCIQVDSVPWSAARPFYDFPDDPHAPIVLFLKRDDDAQWNLQPDALRDDDMRPASRSLSGWNDPFLRQIDLALNFPRGGDDPSRSPSTPWPFSHFNLGFVWKPHPARLIVAAVRPSSAAAVGLFEQDDVILAVEQRLIGKQAEWDGEIVKYTAGQRLNIKVERDGRSRTLGLIMPSLPESPRRVMSEAEFLASFQVRETSLPDYLKEWKNISTIQEKLTKDQVSYGDLVEQNGRRYHHGKLFTGLAVATNRPQRAQTEDAYRDGRLVKILSRHANGGKKIEKTCDDQGHPAHEREWNEEGRLLYEGPIRVNDQPPGAPGK